MPKTTEQIISETVDLLKQPLSDFYSSSATGSWRDHINPIDQLAEVIGKAIANAVTESN